VRELHPLTDQGDRGNASRVGKFNTILNQVIHDKTREPFNRDAIKLIRSVARKDRLADYGRARAPPGDILEDNAENNRRVEGYVEAIKGREKKFGSKIAAGAGSDEAANPIQGENA
jgi:hypothetical protein